MSVTIVVNGQLRAFEAFEQLSLGQLVTELGFQTDRVAIERNGLIVPRGRWSETSLTNGDRLEMVHFVGGGTSSDVQQ